MRWRGDILGLAIVIAVVLIAYHDVAFDGKTFSTASVVPGAQGCIDRRCTQLNVSDPRVDPPASAWQFEPWAHVTSSALHSSHLPLWNPYEGSGAPLAANMQSAAFDPLLAAVNFHPTPLTWDLTFLLTLVASAMLTYALARVLGLRITAGVVGGVVYGLSGYFFFYSNNSFFRSYLYLPLILLTIEWVLRSSRMLPILACAAAVVGLVLVGMPEAIFTTLFFSAIYALGRVFCGPRAVPRGNSAARLASAGMLGLALAAPVLLPFREYVSAAINYKQGAGTTSLPRIDLLNWFVPKIRQPAGTSRCVGIKGCGTTAWSGGLNWVGAGALVAALAAVASRRTLRVLGGWPVVAAGGIVGAKIYGFALISWLGHVPGAAQTNWLVFAQAPVGFALALLAAFGVHAIAVGDVDLRRFLPLVGLGIAATVYFAIRYRAILRHDFVLTDPGGWGFAAAAAAIVGVVVIARRYVKSGTAAALGVGAVIVLELIALAPHGFYFDRTDPYPQASWIRYLETQTRPPHFNRVFSNDQLLYPNIAGVYGLQDARVLDGLLIDRYFDYVRLFISHGIHDRWAAVPNYESAPAMSGNGMFNLLDVRFVAVTEPKLITGSQYQLFRRFGRVYIYENTEALPRAFVVNRLRVVANQAAARRYLTRGQPHHQDGSFVARLDPQHEAIIETSSHDEAVRRVADSRCTSTRAAAATIVSYEAQRVDLRVDAPCGGLLVLDDAYYPAWRVSVDGATSKVYATDYAFRGVVVPAGHSHVVFEYSPRSLGAGVIIATVGLIGFVVIAESARRRRRRRAERPAYSEPVESRESIPVAQRSGLPC